MLSVRRLSVEGFGQEHGLTDISFEIQKGEIVAVIGPNGAGKSLLLDAIADPDSRFTGEVIVNHFHSHSEPAKVKLQIGYASSSLGVEPYLTGFEYLELLASFYGLPVCERAVQITQLARQFGCQDNLYHLLERQGPAAHQKLWLISSLIHQPPLLLWDEPTEYLDEIGRQAVVRELKQAVADGATALVATNDLTFAEAIADRCVVLSHGRIITEGTVAQLCHLAGQHKSHLAAAFQHLLADEH